MRTLVGSRCLCVHSSLLSRNRCGNQMWWLTCSGTWNVLGLSCLFLWLWRVIIKPSGAFSSSGLWCGQLTGGHSGKWDSVAHVCPQFWCCCVWHCVLFISLLMFLFLFLYGGLIIIIFFFFFFSCGDKVHVSLHINSSLFKWINYWPWNTMSRTRTLQVFVHITAVLGLFDF